MRRPEWMRAGPRAPRPGAEIRMSDNEIGGTKPEVEPRSDEDRDVAPKDAAPEREELPPREFVVAIGASAGGLESLIALFSSLPTDLDIPYVVVQHLSPTHRSLLAQLIGRETKMRVVDIEDGVTPEPNTVYITPSNWNLVYRDHRLHLVEPVKEVSPKPSVNLFFTSLAELKGEDAIGVVLSGTGTDGANGIRAIKAAGGFTFAQEPSTARYNGMPQAAIDTGSVDWVLSPEEMAREIGAIARSRGLIRLQGREEGPTTLKTLLHRVRQRTKIDFSDYKETTLWRRIERRMAANHVRSIEEYLALTGDRPEELDRLSKDILISVTAFFRDREAFAALREAIAELLRGKQEGSEIRLWVTGCATGEEAYSIAILLVEQLGPRLRDYSVQIFATDIDTDALATARKGVYPVTAISDLEPALAARYFSVRGEWCEVAKPLRELVLFARQDLAQDPPFLRLDFVSCRNVLIYFNPTLQAQVFSVFHYALQSGGALFLGKSENILPHLGLFEVVHKDAKIFRRTSAPAAPSLRSIGSFSMPRDARPAAPAPVKERTPEERVLLAGAAAYLPPSLLVDNALEIQFAYGDVAGLLEYPTGRPSHNIARALRKEIRAEVQMLVYRARQRRGPAHGVPRTLNVGGEIRSLRVAVHPVPPDPGTRAHADDVAASFLISFEMAPSLPLPSSFSEERAAEHDAMALKTLQDELATTREHLQTLVEELETSNEEMQALNEELQASNEELQSTNEEMETANEELQSTNEELTTVNEELQVKASQLAEANADLENIQSSAEFPILVVDEHLRVTRYNDAAARAFGLGAGVLLRSVMEIDFSPPIRDLAGKIVGVVRERRSFEEQIGDARRHYLVRISPYLTAMRQVRGAVLSFWDNTGLFSAERDLRESQERLLAVMNNSTAIITVKDTAGRYEFANARFQALFGLAPADVLGKTDDQALPPDIGSIFRDRDLEVLRQRRAVESEDALQIGGERRWFLAIRFPLRTADGVIRAICAMLTDITERKEIDRLKNEFVSMVSHELRTPLTSIRGALGLLSGGVTGELPDKAREMVELALRNSDRLTRLVSDILDIERIESRRLPFANQRHELLPLVESALEMSDGVAREYGVRFELDGSIPGAAVVVDADRLIQCVANLLSNGAKFSPRGEEVTVSMARVRGGRLRVSVQDRGGGIPEEFRAKVFEKFAQADSSDVRQKEGAGLGLAIAKALVEAMGGTIGFNANPDMGTGTTFYIELPEAT